ncbi:hypothetical protein QAD02_000345 [Eretmocerus hayati]|uniref:Uncharacterized protein n=1 Tax=Eretmocerus hayati TaxID=131215 RepID=A0ACC2NEP1_9HYME|nr:hypothetical protein QAD02_000345 [Eretmocerus hayati]
MIGIVIFCIFILFTGCRADLRKFTKGIEEQVDKNPLAIVQYIENLEKEAKTFQKKISGWKPKAYNKTDVTGALAQHPLILNEKDRFARTENKTLVCLIAYYVKFQRLVDEFNKGSKNTVCQSEKEYRDMLASTIVNLIKLKKELKKHLNKVVNFPSFPTDAEDCKRSKYFKGYITQIVSKTDIFYKLKTLFPTLKESCLREKYETKEALARIRKTFVDPIEKCITQSHSESGTVSSFQHGNTSNVDEILIQLKRFESLSHDFWIKVRGFKEDTPSLKEQISLKLNRNPLVVKARDRLEKNGFEKFECGSLFESKLQNLIREIQLNVIVNLDSALHDFDLSIDSVLTDIINTRKKLEEMLSSGVSPDNVNYDLAEKLLQKYMTKAEIGFNIISKLEVALPSTIMRSLSMSDEENIYEPIKELLYDPVIDCAEQVKVTSREEPLSVLRDFKLHQVKSANFEKNLEKVRSQTPVIVKYILNNLSRHPAIQTIQNAVNEDKVKGTECRKVFELNFRLLAGEFGSNQTSALNDTLKEMSDILHPLAKDLRESKKAVNDRLRNTVHEISLCKGSYRDCRFLEEYIDRAIFGYGLIDSLRHIMSEVIEKHVATVEDPELSRLIHEKIEIPVSNCLRE